MNSETLTISFSHNLHISILGILKKKKNNCIIYTAISHTVENLTQYCKSFIISGIFIYNFMCPKYKFGYTVLEFAMLSFLNSDFHLSFIISIIQNSQGTEYAKIKKKSKNKSLVNSK